MSCFNNNGCGCNSKPINNCGCNNKPISSCDSPQYKSCMQCNQYTEISNCKCMQASEVNKEAEQYAKKANELQASAERLQQQANKVACEAQDAWEMYNQLSAESTILMQEAQEALNLAIQCQQQCGANIVDNRPCCSDCKPCCNKKC